MVTPPLLARLAIASILLGWLASCRTGGGSNPLAPAATSASRLDTAAYRPYRQELAQLAAADRQDRQALFQVFKRRGFRSPAADSANRWLRHQDSVRLLAFQAAEQRYGWPRATTTGPAAVQDAYLLVQHAPAAVHARYQRTLRAAYARGDLSGFNYATYLDRVLVHQGKRQRYGTQRRRRVLATGQEEDYLEPVADLKHVDKRRARMQLDPILPRLQPGTLILKPSDH